MYSAGKHTIATLRRFRQPVEVDDPHYLEMLKYKEVPMWWYLTLFVISLAVGIGCSVSILFRSFCTRTDVSSIVVHDRLGIAAMVEHHPLHGDQLLPRDRAGLHHCDDGL